MDDRKRIEELEAELAQVRGERDYLQDLCRRLKEHSDEFLAYGDVLADRLRRSLDVVAAMSRVVVEQKQVIATLTQGPAEVN